MRSRRKVLAVLFAVSLNVLLCGALFRPVSVSIDTEERAVYEYCRAEDLLADFESDSESAEAAYDGQRFVISGRVAGISKNRERHQFKGNIGKI